MLCWMIAAVMAMKEKLIITLNIKCLFFSCKTKCTKPKNILVTVPARVESNINSGLALM